MVRLLEIQDKLKQELAAAMESNDSAELNRLIVKSDKLEMGSEPIVLQAKEVRRSVVVCVASVLSLCSLRKCSRVLGGIVFRTGGF